MILRYVHAHFNNARLRRDGSGDSANVLLYNFGMIAIYKFIGHTYMKIFGWKVVGPIVPADQCIIVCAYHTSNWDLAFCIAINFISGRKAHWLAKKSIFIWPFGPIFRAIGGIPVDRSKGHGLVGTVIDEFKKHPRLVFAVTPEGTRSYVQHWKMGFYQMALATGVPIQCLGFDYGNKQLVFSDLYYATPDVEALFVQLRAFFNTTTPKFPEKTERHFLPRT